MTTASRQSDYRPTSSGHARPRRHDQGPVRAPLGRRAGAVRARRAVVRRRGGLRHVHRHPRRRSPAVHRLGQQPLGAGAAALRRPRRAAGPRTRRAALRVPRGQRRRRWPGSGSSRPAPPTNPTSSTPGSSRRRCSAATTAGAPSRSCAACGTTRTARSGSRAAAGSASTPSSCTPTTPIAC